MKMKKAIPTYLFLSLFLVSQGAQAWGVLRIFGGAGRGAAAASRAGKLARAGKIGRAGKSAKTLGKFGREALIAGAGGIVTNEAYEYYNQYQSEPKTVFTPNYPPRPESEKKEHYMYVNTLEFGKSDLVW